LACDYNERKIELLVSRYFTYHSLAIYDNPQIYKSDKFSLIPMSNKYTTTALYAALVASVLVASVFAISYIQQQALAQGNQTGGGNQTSGNNTSGAAGSNRASGNATGGGTAANPPS
jgi:hypothetical protein